MPSRDHFTPLASAYAEFRPTYPAALFDWLAEISPGRGLAWDCACGSGQATQDLAVRFERVFASDTSAAQLAAAPAHARVEYRQAAAEASGLETACIDLITVAQALHWFDLPGFYAEARRVLKSGGALAVWSYGVLKLDDSRVNALVQHFYHAVVGPYWPAERILVEQGYRSLAFPFAERAAPTFALRADWNLPRLLGYFRSWSATGRYRQARGADPVIPLTKEIARVWGDPEQKRTVTWPLALRVGHHTGS